MWKLFTGFAGEVLRNLHVRHVSTFGYLLNLCMSLEWYQPKVGRKYLHKYIGQYSYPHLTSIINVSWIGLNISNRWSFIFYPKLKNLSLRMINDSQFWYWKATDGPPEDREIHKVVIPCWHSYIGKGSRHGIWHRASFHCFCWRW